MADVSVLLPDGSQETYSNVETVTLDSAAGDGTQEVFVSQRLIQNQLQTDWLQEDESAVDYLKNRPFGDIPANLPETEVAFSPMEDFPNTYGAVCDGRELLLGKSYVVKWGEAEYTCVCKELGGSADLYLGNPTKLFLPQGVDTGEPFYVAWNGEKLVFQTDQTDATRIIGITPVNAVKKLDKKYLPDGLATEEFVTQEIAKIEIPEGSGGAGITVADVTAMLASAGVIVPVAVENNLLLSDSKNDIYIL